MELLTLLHFAINSFLFWIIRILRHIKILPPAPHNIPAVTKTFFYRPSEKIISDEYVLSELDVL